MNHMSSKFFAVVFFIFVLDISLYSQTNECTYEVATWRGFKNAAISYTFDDNCSNQLNTAVPLFDEYGYKLTLFTVIDWSPNWEALKSAAENGHEIASHTITHPSLNELSDELQENELKNSQMVINSNIGKNKCRTFAYPYCRIGNASLVEKYYFASRGCQGYIENQTPSDFNNISSIICGAKDRINTGEDFCAMSDSAAKAKGWCVYLIHGIDDDGGYSTLSSAALQESLEHLKDNQDKFWVDTFGNVACYIMERNSVSVSELSSNENSISFLVTDQLDNEYYNYPITIRRPLPAGWRNIIVTQNNQILSSKIVEIGSVTYIMVDVIPDGGVISINKKVNNY